MYSRLSKSENVQLPGLPEEQEKSIFDKIITLRKNYVTEMINYLFVHAVSITHLLLFGNAANVLQ